MEKENTTDPMSIFSVSDFRSFLRAHHEKKKQEKPNWSMGMWAKIMGISGASALSMVLKGDRNPGPELTKKLNQYFEFNTQERKYFEKLILLEKHKKDPELKSVLIETLIQLHPQKKFDKLDFKEFEVISKWYCTLVRELIDHKAFKEDPNWISKISTFSLSPKEVKEALMTLTEAGFVERGTNGQLKNSVKDFETPNDIASEPLKRFHEAMIDHAKKALRKTSPPDREIRGVTLKVSKEKLNQAKTLIRRFEDEFAEYFEDEENSGEVYQLNIQLFPLTQINTKERIRNEN